MRNELITIQNVRGYIDEKGTACLNLEDVARGLGFVEIAKSGNEVVRWRTIRKYLLSLGIIATSCDGQGKENLPDFIPENIFYKLCMKANNEVARKFQDIVADEILPSIRKHGMYANTETLDRMISNPDFAIKLLTTLKEEREAKKLLEAKIETDKPLVEFANNVAKSSDSILVRDFVKIFSNSEIQIGQKKMFEWLKDKGFITKVDNNATQKSIDMKVMEVIEYAIQTPYGIKLKSTTKVTGKGQIYFTERLRKELTVDKI